MQSTHSELHTCPIIVTSSHMSPVAAMTLVNHGTWDMCPVVFKQESAANHNRTFLETCPEPLATWVALPGMIAAKSQHASHPHSGSLLRVRSLPHINIAPWHTRREPLGTLAFQVWHLVCQLLLKGWSTPLWNHSTVKPPYPNLMTNCVLVIPILFFFSFLFHHNYFHTFYCNFFKAPSSGWNDQKRSPNFFLHPALWKWHFRI